jgi:hypothetical protein
MPSLNPSNETAIKKMPENNKQKCYNSLSCVLSVLIILFVVGAIAWDITISKPAMKKSIEEIRTEVKGIHQKIDKQIQADSMYVEYMEHAHEHLDSIKKLNK